ncbi:hypothetical protein BDA99DRAFT_514939 [Phascolomyces articulosus]|uniref:Uncharacterized protein n=1 Tax=Phascolomyces articulosus TaxID=60185 RepID=A0AAD5JWU6_9FUNG|nr:hypothetical protein BDA99DRAFT_514939 [Phascolomyces articulosus]
MRSLSFVLTILATALVTNNVAADPSYNDLHELLKRQSATPEKLPYDTLPQTTCTQPQACSNIQQPLECRCSPLLTICKNTGGQFCWGSATLNQTQGCPSVPDSCGASLNGTSSCLCNSDTLLCVDNYRHYCYGSFEGSGAQASVSVKAFPSDGAAPSSAANTAAPSNNDESGATTTMKASLLGTAAVIGTIVSLSL